MKRLNVTLFFFVSLVITSAILSAQNNLQDQMRELDRLQARLKSLQNASGDSSDTVGKEKYGENEVLKNGRFQIINMDYKINVPNTNTITIIKGPIKLDTSTGETWRYVINGYDEYWKKID